MQQLIPEFINQQIARAQSIGEALTYNFGQPGGIQNNQTYQPTLTSNKPGFGVRSVGQPIQQQIPVTQPVIDQSGREVLQGPTPSVAAPGAVVAPPPVNSRLPVAPLPPANVNAGPAPVQNKDQTRVGAPSGPAIGQPVLFEENKKAHVADYQQAGEIIQNLRPLQQAYKLIDEFNPRSGPLSEQINKLAATLKANNIIQTDIKNDPTAIYQEINKKLMQFVAQQGAPSDKQQAAQFEGNPSLKTQIPQALKKLTYDTIALQRSRAILPHMYEGKDYGNKNFNAERFINTNSISEKAIMFDYLKTDKEKDALLEEMGKKRNTKEGRDFWKTFYAADKANLIDTGNR